MGEALQWTNDIDVRQIRQIKESMTSSNLSKD